LQAVEEFHGGKIKNVRQANTKSLSGFYCENSSKRSHSMNKVGAEKYSEEPKTTVRKKF
jgi:hypothetical protein